MLGLGDLLNNPLAKTVATAFAGPLAPIGMDLLSSATKGGSDPLQLLGAISDPFKALFGQANTQLATPFRSIPSSFSGLGGTVGSALGNLGNIDGQLAKAAQLAQSDKVEDQIAGRKLADQAFAALNFAVSVTKAFGEVQKEIAKF
jgi:hypothetical protein